MRTTDDRTRVRQRLAELAPHEPVQVIGPHLLRTPRLIVRPLRDDDQAAYLDLVERSRPELEPVLPLHEPGESDADFFRRHLLLARRGDETGSAWRRVVTLHEGRLAGSVNLNHIERGLQFQADMNWWIGTKMAGQGLATEAVLAVLRYAARDLPEGLGLHAVHCGIMPSNAASIRVAQKAGFVRDAAGEMHMRIGDRWCRHEMWVWQAR